MPIAVGFNKAREGLCNQVTSSRLSHDVVLCGIDRDVSTASATASLRQATRSTAYASSQVTTS